MRIDITSVDVVGAQNGKKNPLEEPMIKKKPEREIKNLEENGDV